MKKFSIFLSLLMTSFFLLSQNVKAIDITINESVFDYVTDERFEYLRNYAIDYCNNHPEYNYLISYYGATYPADGYYLDFFSSNASVLIDTYSLTTSGNGPVYKLENASLVFQGNSNSVLTYVNNSNSINFRTYLDTNANALVSSSYYGSTYNVFYNDYSFSIFKGANVPSLYSIYRETHVIEEPDNTPILTTFYTTIGSKIAWLGEQFTESYIYLAILGVFILIFLIELIRRYLL